jgi:crotonobetainyl-CoA:carnitine CoA-transferase CaiB-like acyl-CoA transferase
VANLGREDRVEVREQRKSAAFDRAEAAEHVMVAERQHFLGAEFPQPPFDVGCPAAFVEGGRRNCPHGRRLALTEVGVVVQPVQCPLNIGALYDGAYVTRRRVRLRPRRPAEHLEPPARRYNPLGGTAGAKEAFYRLADQADVIVEGYRPGVVKRLGVDYETLSARNPRLVYCSITGYGQDGPYRLLVGHDVNYAAMAGALSIMGPRGGAPAIPGNLLGDYAGGGMHAAIGILTALMARARTGRGQYVDISMTDGVLNLLAAALSESLASGVPIRRGEHRLNGGVPYYNVYSCADGRHLSVGANEAWFYDNLCNAIGRPDLAGLQADRTRHAEIATAFADAFRTKTRDEWFALLQDKDVCVAPVYDLEEVADDPQIRAREMIVDLPHPEFGSVRQVGVSAKLSDTPGTVRHTAPLRGANTDDVLREAGLSASEIGALRAAGGTS